jgi:hypothetical protein
LILYFCPDSPHKSAGIRILYDHVRILTAHGHNAAVLHSAAGFRIADVPEAPIRYLASPNAISPGDIVVIPEGYPRIMVGLRTQPVRRIAIALNWRYVYSGLGDGCDWRDFNIERVITYSPHIGDFVAWAMGLPVHQFQISIDPQLYYCQPNEKMAQISFLTRKQGEMAELRRVLWSRNRRFIDEINWMGLDNLSEAEYARQIRRSSIFINMSPFEGLHIPVLEAMRSGTLVAGYNSVGTQREMIGAGEKQNCILAETMDYITLAQKLEPALLDLLGGNMNRWSGILKNGLDATTGYTPQAEDTSVLSMWTKILNPHHV